MKSLEVIMWIIQGTSILIDIAKSDVVKYILKDWKVEKLK